MNSLTSVLLIVVGLLNLEFNVAFMTPSPLTPGSKLGEAATTEVATAVTAEELSARMGTTAIFTSEDIDKILPHRYPFALVDRVVEYEAGKRAIGIKSVTKVCFFFISFLFLHIAKEIIIHFAFISFLL